MNRSRHITLETTKLLEEQSRHRCCLCRSILIPEESNPADLSAGLERHHIIYFADGGENSIENLALVCSNCHTRIHLPESELTSDKVKEKRDHWYGMKEVVGSHVPASKELRSANKPLTEVPFTIESLNLTYWVTCPRDASIACLGAIIGERIIRPLGEYDTNQDWINCRDLALALRSNPASPLSAVASIESIVRYDDPDSPFKRGDSFVALVTRTVLLFPGRLLRISIVPNPPLEGRPYEILVDGAIDLEVELGVSGTDGYSNTVTVRPDLDNRTGCLVPGARRGVVDEIWARTRLDETKIAVEFQAKA